MTTLLHARSYGRFLQRWRATSGERKFKELIKVSIFLEAVLVMEIMKENQSTLEEKGSLSILKDYFSSRINPYIFTSIAPEVLDWSDKTSGVFPELKSTSYFLPQSTVSRRSDSSTEAKSGCYHKSDACSHLEQRVASSAEITILQITFTGRSLMYSRKSLGPRMEA